MPETRFIEGSGVAVNTIPPNDFGYWETINALVQQEPAGAGDPETMGLLAAVGIVKGQPFKPGQRMRKILEDAVAVGNATARTISFAPRPEEGFAYYPGSAWINMLFTGGYQFLDPPPQITADGPVPAPSDGARKLNSRIAFFYPATGTTPAMCMRLTGIGSQYLIAMRDSGGEFLDGGRSYRLTLPPGIPESRFWSVIALRQPDPLHAPDRPAAGQTSAASPAPSRPTRTAPPTSTSDPPPPTGRPRRTGSRPSRARASSRSCGSTTLSSRSSTRPGGPARSNRTDN